MGYQTGVVLLSPTVQVLEYWFGEARNEFSRVIPLLLSSDGFHISFPQPTCVIFGNDASTCSQPMNTKKQNQGVAR